MTAIEIVLAKTGLARNLVAELLAKTPGAVPIIENTDGITEPEIRELLRINFEDPKSSSK